MNRLQDSKAFKGFVWVVLSVVILQIAEYLLYREGLMLRTAAQIIKGIYVWLAAPVLATLCLFLMMRRLHKRLPDWLETLFLVLSILLILGVSFCRGMYYYFSDEFVEEETLEDGMIAGWYSNALSSTMTTYYEPVFGIFRKPFSGWTDTELTEKLQARYGDDVTQTGPKYSGVLTYTAESIRPQTAPFTFQADRSYTISDNFAYQLMKSDAVRFWENQGRVISFLAVEDTGGSDFTSYALDSDRADTSKYPDAKDRLELLCHSEDDIPNCAAAIADWLTYALEDDRYYQNDGIPGQNYQCPINYIYLRLGTDRYRLSLYDIIIDMDTDSWAETVEKLTEHIEGKLGITGPTDTDPDAESSSSRVSPQEDADALFMKSYQGDYEKECSIGDGTVRYRMVVRDAALGSRLYSLLKSTDSGVTWEMAAGDPFRQQTGMGIDFTFLDESFGFATLMHNGGDEAVLYVTEDGGQSYQTCLIQGVSATLDDGYLYNPYDYPEMPYEEDGVLYVLCGQGLDGDYDGGDANGKALFASTDHGHTFLFQEIVKP